VEREKIYILQSRPITTIRKEEKASRFASLGGVDASLYPLALLQWVL